MTIEFGALAVLHDLLEIALQVFGQFVIAARVFRPSRTCQRFLAIRR